MAHGTGLLGNQTWFPCRVVVACPKLRPQLQPRAVSLPRSPPHSHRSHPPLKTGQVLTFGNIVEMPVTSWPFVKDLRIYDASYANLLENMLVFDLDRQHSPSSSFEVENFTQIFRRHFCFLGSMWIGRYLNAV